MMDRVIEILKSNWLNLLGALIGGVVGYLYWYHVGCSTGTCPMTASPTMTIAWGAVMGSLVFGLFKKRKNE